MLLPIPLPPKFADLEIQTIKQEGGVENHELNFLASEINSAKTDRITRFGSKLSEFRICPVTGDILLDFTHFAIAPNS